MIESPNIRVQRCYSCERATKHEYKTKGAGEGWGWFCTVCGVETPAEGRLLEKSKQLRTLVGEYETDRDRIRLIFTALFSAAAPAKLQQRLQCLVCGEFTVEAVDSSIGMYVVCANEECGEVYWPPEGR